MQYQRRAIRKSRAIRTKAIFITLLFHMALIGYFVYGADQSITDYLPETVKEWAGWSAPDVADQPEAPRP